MAYPPRFTRSFSFTDWETSHPGQPKPGPQLDTQFDNVANALTGTQDTLALIQRADGALANDSVGEDQLQDGVFDGIVDEATADAEAAAAAAAGSASAAASSASAAASSATAAATSAGVASGAAAAAGTAQGIAQTAATDANTAADDADAAADAAELAANSTQNSVAQAQLHEETAFKWAEYLAAPVMPAPNGWPEAVDDGMWSAKWWALRARDYNSVHHINLGTGQSDIGAAFDQWDLTHDLPPGLIYATWGTPPKVYALTDPTNPSNPASWTLITGGTGPAGPPNTLTIGTVVTGTPAAASITGTAPNQVLNLTIPAGPTGATGAQGPPGVAGPAGPANTLNIGTVTTGAAGSAAGASITGAAPNQILNLTIPTGAVGPAGPTGAIGPTGPTGATGPIGATGPTGATGPQGIQGNDGFAGQDGTDGFPGPQGDPGPAGPTGPTGPTGATGPAGSGSPANPTASVGTAVINGVATTFMRSDAAPAINLAMNATWTGVHIFTSVRTIIGAAATPTVTVGSNAAGLQITGVTDNIRSSMHIARFSADTLSPFFRFAKSRNTAAYDGAVAVAANDLLGTIEWFGADGAAAPLNTSAARIQVLATGTIAVGQVPGEMRFHTAQNLTGALTERLRINNVGAFAFAGQFGTAGQYLQSAGSTGPPTWGTFTLGAGQFANPLNVIGLSQTNGTALTAMRSDATPALSQAINPTWSAQHFFDATGHGISTAIRLRSNDPGISFRDLDAAVGAKEYEFIVNGANGFQFGMLDDAGANFRQGWRATAVAGGFSIIEFGNTTDNPPFNFAGTGACTHGGQVRIPAGSNTVPGLAITGDIDTGIFGPAADYLALVTGGVARLYATPAGGITVGAKGHVVYHNDVAMTSGAVTVQSTVPTSGGAIGDQWLVV